MNTILQIYALLSILLLTTHVNADSYGSFVDRIEVDRNGVVFASVRGYITKSLERRITVVIWTRMHPEALKRLPRHEAGRQKPSADAAISAGPMRVVFEGTFDRHPGLVRISSSSIAILDYHGINLGDLKNGPAVQIVSFDKQRELSLRLDEIFPSGTKRYYRGRGVVSWLHDAWFDETGQRMFVASRYHSTNSNGHEVAIIDLKTGEVMAADRTVIKEQLSRVERRFLHSVLHVAISFDIEEVSEVAKKVFSDETMPLEARTRAAAHLANLGNAAALQLIRELAELSLTDPADVQHPAVSPTLVFEDEYWWNTIGYAKRVLDPAVDEPDGE